MPALCRNVLVDDDNNAKIINIINGEELTEGWAPESSRFPTWDIYNLYITLWELAHDSRSLVGMDVRPVNLSPLR